MKDLARAVGLMALAASAVSAQTSTGDAVAASALSASNVGSLTPLVTPAMLSRRLYGAQLAVRYGLHSTDTPTHAFAASAVFGMGMASSVTLTAGFRTVNNCSSCSSGQLMLGIGGDMRIAEMTDFIGTGNSLTLAVGGDAAFARAQPLADNAFALGVSAPITWVIRSSTEAMRIAPFFVPTFGIGQANVSCGLLTDCSNNGTRFLLGGGVAFWNPASNVAITVGVQDLLIDRNRPVYGINLLIGGAR